MGGIKNVNGCNSGVDNGGGWMGVGGGGEEREKWH